jgi:hypothetical protein
MEIYARLLEGTTDSEEYRSMTAEWDSYFASQTYKSNDAVWRNAVLQVLEQLGILEDEHKSDPQRAVQALVNEGGRGVARRRATD